MAEQWMTSFKKQCFVVIGASINMSQLSMIMGYGAPLLSQLRTEGASNTTPIDVSSASWIASLPGFSLLIGNLTIPTLMAKLGRRKASLISIFIIICAWICLVTARNINWILVARFLQGLSSGMSCCLTPIIIGEYTSPKNRGTFTMLMSLIMGAAVLIVHTVGSYMTWKMTALVIAIISFINLLIVALSPETPSWLAAQGRYEECEKVFRWLRDEEEIDELHRLIQSSIATRQSRNINSSKPSKVKGYISTVKKKEFYTPILIMIHLYTIAQWGGLNILSVYIIDIIQNTVDINANIVLIVVSVGLQRVVSSIVAVFIIRRVKRRTMLFITCSTNTFIFLITAGYVYARNVAVLPFDHPLIGILLIHALMMSVSMGSLPLPYTIAGEIFALRYKSLSSGISALFNSISIFMTAMSFPLLIQSVGLHGAYCVYSGIMVYCLAVVWFILPETKDKTLQDIEDEFKGIVGDEDLRATQPLTVIRDLDVEE